MSASNDSHQDSDQAILVIGFESAQRSLGVEPRTTEALNALTTLRKADYSVEFSTISASVIQALSTRTARSVIHLLGFPFFSTSAHILPL